MGCRGATTKLATSRGQTRIGCIGLVVVSLGIIGFGIAIAILPMGADELLYRADGLASVRALGVDRSMVLPGLFGPSI